MTASEVEDRLAAAGQVLLSLPHAGCFPAGFRSLWPGYVEASPSSDFLPSPAEISAMDEAYRWVGLLLDVDERRLVLMRSLVRPGSPGALRRYVWTRRRLRKSTGRIARALNDAIGPMPARSRIVAARCMSTLTMRFSDIPSNRGPTAGRQALEIRSH
jgi:hypothetical protein